LENNSEDGLEQEEGNRTGEATMSYFWFTFEDGYRVCVLGFSDRELAFEVIKHGRVVKKESAL
jgi:hypothetical protein